jgi:predicted DNA-binding ribbon-helix-helix protein
VVTFPHDPERPDEVAVMRLTGTRTATSVEWARYAALRKLAEPSPGSMLRPVSLAVLGVLAADNFWPDTSVRLVRPAWAPTLKQLGADVTGQSALLITTTEDSRRHRVLAGAAAHSTRLSAAIRGFTTRTVPLRMQADVERDRFVEESLLPGFPQGLLLVGLRPPKRRQN